MKIGGPKEKQRDLSRLSHLYLYNSQNTAILRKQTADDFLKYSKGRIVALVWFSGMGKKRNDNKEIFVGVCARAHRSNVYFICMCPNVRLKES